MPQSLANVLIHVVFSTKNRSPWIVPEIEEELYCYLSTACRSCGSPAHKIGGMCDHVHLICSLARTLTIADLLGTVKADSSKWLKTKGRQYTDFAWQNGYGAFSVGQSQLESVTSYVASQKEHHRVRTFQEEFREILRRYHVEYDEQYVWD